MYQIQKCLLVPYKNKQTCSYSSIFIQADICPIKQAYMFCIQTGRHFLYKTSRHRINSTVYCTNRQTGVIYKKEYMCQILKCRHMP